MSNNLEYDWSSEGVTQFMDVTMGTRCLKLDFSLAKHLPIANSSLGLEFLAQVRRHYDSYYYES